MQKKHQVFVCSTYMDLKEQRQALFIEMYRNRFIPIGMEGLVPANQGQLDYIRERIDESDFAVAT
jgi:predicted nucleotide-binding protein